MSLSASSVSYLQQITLVDGDTNIAYEIRLPYNEIRRLETDAEYAKTVLNQYKAHVASADEQCESADVERPIGHSESPSPPEGVSASPDNGIEDGFRWSHEAVLLLVSLMEKNQVKFSSPRFTNKSVWTCIASEFEEHGYILSAKQCESKWSGLKKVYKKMKDHNNKSGNDRRNWKYFEIIDNLLGKRPEINPVSTADSNANQSGSQKNLVEKNKPWQSPLSDSSVDKLHERNDNRGNKRKLSQQEMFDVMEANKSARHRERIEQNNKIIALLEKILPSGD